MAITVPVGWDSLWGSRRFHRADYSDNAASVVFSRDEA